MKVYVVTVGDYSSKYNVAVFDEQHLDEARRFAELTGCDLDEEEVYELNGPDMDEPPPGKEWFVISMNRDGKAEVRNYGDDGVLDLDGKRRQGEYKLWTHKDALFERKSHWRLIGKLYADSEEHAIKVVNELRGHILAGAAPTENEQWHV